MIKRLIFASMLLCVCGVPATRAQVFLPSDIEFFVGTGANEAYFVVDWQNSLTPRALAWGYRWDGVKTGEDMLKDIAAADIWLVEDGFTFPFGYALYALGYDLVQDLSGFTIGSVPAEDGFANNPLNHYREGFGYSVGYWSYWTDNGTNPYDGGAWVLSGVGMSARILVNGGWDGWSFNTDLVTYIEPPPGLPVAAPIPEAGGVVWLVLAMLVIVVAGRLKKFAFASLGARRQL